MALAQRTIGRRSDDTPAFEDRLEVKLGNIPASSSRTLCHDIARYRLSAFVRAQAQSISRRHSIGYEEHNDAPETYLDIRDGFNRALIVGTPVFVSKHNSDTSIYMHESDNWAFRFWHDYLHYKHELTFSFFDEICVHQFHVHAVEQEFGVGSLEAKFMTADTMGQTMHFKMHGMHVKDQLAFAKAFIVSH